MSEVQKIRDQIEQEAAILQFLKNGFKTVASHELINHALDQLGVHHEQLGKLIGPEKAIEIVVEAIEKDYLPETLEVGSNRERALDNLRIPE